MLEVTGEKLTERERTCLEYFRQAANCGGDFAAYCQSNGRSG